jgi:acyl-CoA thioesterase YciA
MFPLVLAGCVPQFTTIALKPGDSMSEPWIAIQVVMQPKDANSHPGMLPGFGQYPLYSTIFGGVLLANIDLAGAIAAQRELQLRGGNPKAAFVTVAINRVEFRKPVHVGDVVRFETSILRIGRTSITVKIDVYAERGAETIHVTEAEAVFVGVDLSTPERNPVPLFPQNA